MNTNKQFQGKPGNLRGLINSGSATAVQSLVYHSSTDVPCSIHPAPGKSRISCVNGYEVDTRMQQLNGPGPVLLFSSVHRSEHPEKRHFRFS